MVCTYGPPISMTKHVALIRCQQLCDAEPTCAAFEYGVVYNRNPPPSVFGNTHYPALGSGDCVLKADSDLAGCDGGSMNADLYLRENVPPPPPGATTPAPTRGGSTIAPPPEEKAPEPAKPEEPAAPPPAAKPVKVDYEKHPTPSEWIYDHPGKPFDNQTVPENIVDEKGMWKIEHIGTAAVAVNEQTEERRYIRRKSSWVYVESINEVAPTSTCKQGNFEVAGAGILPFNGCYHPLPATFNGVSIYGTDNKQAFIFRSEGIWYLGPEASEASKALYQSSGEPGQGLPPKIGWLPVPGAALPAPTFTLSTGHHKPMKVGGPVEFEVYRALNGWTFHIVGPGKAEAAHIDGTKRLCMYREFPEPTGTTTYAPGDCIAPHMLEFRTQASAMTFITSLDRQINDLLAPLVERSDDSANCFSEYAGKCTECGSRCRILRDDCLTSCSVDPACAATPDCPCKAKCQEHYDHHCVSNSMRHCACHCNELLEKAKGFSKATTCEKVTLAVHETLGVERCNRMCVTDPVDPGVAAAAATGLTTASPFGTTPFR